VEKIYEYFYDTSGWRLFKKRSITNTEKGRKKEYDTTVYIRSLSGGNVLEERRADNSIDKILVSGLIEADGEGNIKGYFHKDALGSTVIETDPNGGVIQKTRYDAFGGIEWQENELEKGEKPNNLLYNGMEVDSDGLSFRGPRQLNFDLGRWMSKDKIPGVINDPLSLNRYVYAKNNPYKFLDINGLDDILFDGKYVYWRDDNQKIVLILKARSGLLPSNPQNPDQRNYTSPDFQGEKNKGPIPEDTFEIHLSDNAEPDKSGGGWGRAGWRLKYKNPIKRILEKLNLIRGGFFIHEDHKDDGTGGCIGLFEKGKPMGKARIKWLLNRLKKYAKNNKFIDLIVKYRDSLKNKDKKENNKDDKKKEDE